MAKKQKYYAVKAGHNPGIYLTVEEFRKQTKGYKGAKGRSFKTKEEAIAYLTKSSKSTNKKQKYYAVIKGHTPGIYLTKAELTKQIKGYSYPEYKTFKSKDAAVNYMEKMKNEIQMSILCSCIPSNFKENELIAYVDGSYQSGNAFSYGMVILEKNDMFCCGKKIVNSKFAKLRNVAGEIAGAKAAMEYALYKNAKTLIIHYDYEGIEKICTQKQSNSNECFKEYYQFYKSIKNKLDIKFVKLKSHSGNRYHDLADQLATIALKN